MNAERRERLWNQLNNAAKELAFDMTACRDHLDPKGKYTPGLLRLIDKFEAAENAWEEYIDETRTEIDHALAEEAA